MSAPSEGGEGALSSSQVYANIEARISYSDPGDVNSRKAPRQSNDPRGSESEGGGSARNSAAGDEGVEGGAGGSEPQASKGPVTSIMKRLDRTKSWGSAHIEKLEREQAAADKAKDNADALNHVPFFSKLGYILNFGEPIPDENMHLDDEAWLSKMLSKEHWWVIHPFSNFRRYWDIFLMGLLLYIALMVPFVIGFEVRKRRRSGLPTCLTLPL